MWLEHDRRHFGLGSPAQRPLGLQDRRLYRRRDFEEDALPAFDEICKRHDAEMAGIRDELHAKFAKVPFLETYKQMAIRQQKVKNWAESEWWAARGLQLYGDDAADAMWVDDLQKRLNRAQAKLDEPKAGRRKADSVVKIRASEGQSVPPPITAPTAIEVLTCVRCAIEFERLRVRGRKPTLCPECRL